MFTMMIAPKLMQLTEARNLLLVGLLITAGTLYWTIGYTTDTTAHTIVTVSVLQGVGLGLLFVPVSAVAFLTIPAQLRTGGASITTLLRNIGSSIGISMVIANLTSKTTYMHARLGESVTPFNDALQMPDVAATLNLQTDTGRAMLDQIVTQQATIIAYSNDFKLLMVLCLAATPLVFLFGSSRGPKTGGPAVHAAMD
jgi:DHA2 family multidrug resistance protein